jgi:hypothetical protein
MRPTDKRWRLDGRRAPALALRPLLDRLRSHDGSTCAVDSNSLSRRAAVLEEITGYRDGLLRTVPGSVRLFATPEGNGFADAVDADRRIENRRCKTAATLYFR